jgi:aromatic ring-cleaving dioxygenase
MTEEMVMYRAHVYVDNEIVESSPWLNSFKAARRDARLMAYSWPKGKGKVETYKYKRAVNKKTLN